MKNKDIKSGTSVWINSVGSIDIRVFNVIGEKENKVKIDFGNNEIYIINKKYLRAKRCIIYKLPNGKIKVQNPDNWKNIDLKSYGIKELRFNLQNFALQEGKAALHRWTLPEGIIAKLTPLFKLLLICIVVGVIGWSAFKFGGIVFGNVMSSRLMDCNAVLPNAPIPIGVNIPVTNITTPIG